MRSVHNRIRSRGAMVARSFSAYLFISRAQLTALGGAQFRWHSRLHNSRTESNLHECLAKQEYGIFSITSNGESQSFWANGLALR